MKYGHDIKEEEKGSAHYTAMARKNPKFHATFKSMAKDEEKHEHDLIRMAKTKALNKAKRTGSKDEEGRYRPDADRNRED
jgi:rubrerythrin